MTYEYCVAYLDPGSGAVLLQLLLGIVIGLGISFRRAIARVFGIFRRGGKATVMENRSGN